MSRSLPLRVRRCVLATLALLVVGAAPAHAIDIEPPEITFTPAGGQWFRGNTAVAVGVVDIGGGSITDVEFQLSGAQDGGGKLGRSGGTVSLTKTGITEIAVTAVDNSENTARSVAWFGIDRAEPTVSVTSPFEGARLIQHSTAEFAYQCADGLSGVASCSGTVASGAALDTSTVGTHTVQATAVDRAGHVTTRTVSYEVVTGSFTVSRRADFTGSPKTESIVRAVPPVTTPEATSHTYQWLLDGTPVPGATEATYVVAPADVTKLLSVRVVASRPGYADAVSESRAAWVMWESFTTSRPVITGDLVVGATLSASVEVSPQPTGIFWRWLIDDIVVGDESTYVIRPEDAGKRIVLQAEPWRRGYLAVWPQTEPSAPIRPAAQDLQVTATLSGSPAEGEALELVVSGLPPGAWTEQQWYADGAPIPDATGTSHRLTRAQRGALITVEATVNRIGYVPWRVVTAPVGPVAAGQEPASPPSTPAAGSDQTPSAGAVLVGTPRIVGEAVAGRRLTAQLPAVPAGATAAYQWLSDGAPIATATQPTLQLSSGHVGRRISLRATVTAPGRQSWQQTSAPTSVVAKGRAVLRAQVRKPAKGTGERAGRLVLAIRVSATGLRPTGWVTVVRKGKVLKRSALRPDGTVKIALRGQRPGTQRVTVRYSGDSGTAAAQRNLRIRVR